MKIGKARRLLACRMRRHSAGGGCALLPQIEFAVDCPHSFPLQTLVMKVHTIALLLALAACPTRGARDRLPARRSLLSCGQVYDTCCCQPIVGRG